MKKNKYDKKAAKLQKQISKGLDYHGKKKYNKLIDEFNSLIPHMTHPSGEKVNIR